MSRSQELETFKAIEDIVKKFFKEEMDYKEAIERIKIELELYKKLTDIIKETLKEGTVSEPNDHGLDPDPTKGGRICNGKQSSNHR